MAHELTNTNSIFEFAFNPAHGQPWHTLGQEMAADATIDEWRKSAGMQWEILESPVLYDTVRVSNEHKMLYRSDTFAPLGVVSKKYHTVQPNEVIEFFRHILEKNGLEMSAAGTIFGGKRFWATARIGEATPVSLEDKIGAYVLLSTSADGSLATEARMTTTRTVCSNTLRIAQRDAAKLRVSHRSAFSASAAHAALELDYDAWGAFQKQMQALADTKLSVDQTQALVAKWFDKDQEKAQKTTGYQRILDLFDGRAMGSFMDGVHQTAYGLLQATTEYVDRNPRSRSESSQFASAQWGQGAALKERAFQDLLAMV